ncbi:flagellar export protein FliJ [Clostridium formicaceticum]|uniref:Flagellar FliJ protein n=1 Tax=Clostridium formicaceticum TaxID=1497 RepID=A0AAC9RLI5_9CLOT|nr:flagellar export protein FliJ [Clostridium formicaceticum]AOY77318.1 flagellar export protein FliJ [Clostridium formicaceticum]ARE87862.1 flagellar biosynthesis chaperone [Clostridium formicaceticum]
MAENFVYRFNHILKIKEKIEESKKYQFADVQKDLEKEKSNLAMLIKKRESIIESWNNKTKQNNIVKIKALQDCSNNIQLVEDLIKKQVAKVKNHELRLNQARGELIEAKKQTKTFEKLMEKDYETFVNTQLKNEANLVDQLVTYKSIANKGG